MALSSVDFPQPEGPSSATRSPSFTWKETASVASTMRPALR